MLLDKLSALKKKVIVGGVDLLAKAEEQEKLLQESNNDLEERRRRAEQLRKELEEKEVRNGQWERLRSKPSGTLDQWFATVFPRSPQNHHQLSMPWPNSQTAKIAPTSIETN